MPNKKNKSISYFYNIYSNEYPRFRSWIFFRLLIFSKVFLIPKNNPFFCVINNRSKERIIYLDYLSKKHEYTFWNNKLNLVRVHVSQVANTNYNIWTEGYSKKYRDSIKLIEKAIKKFNPSDLPPIVIVSDLKMGSGGISSYNHNDDVIYFNSHYNNQSRINQVISRRIFAPKNVTDIIQHELGHKMHWDAVKRFYQANKTRYNSIKEAKNELDSKLEAYISKQEPGYLYSTMSIYASKSFEMKKKYNSNNAVNEVIAEFTVKKRTIDTTLNELIERELSYGKI